MPKPGCASMILFTQIRCSMLDNVITFSVYGFWGGRNCRASPKSVIFMVWLARSTRTFCSDRMDDNMRVSSQNYINSWGSRECNKHVALNKANKGSKAYQAREQCLAGEVTGGTVQQCTPINHPVPLLAGRQAPLATQAHMAHNTNQKRIPVA
jgi:hypothetical protein